MNLLSILGLKKKVNLEENEEFAIYVHCFGLNREKKYRTIEHVPIIAISGKTIGYTPKKVTKKIILDITPKEDNFIYLDGFKGAFKVKSVRELGHSAMYQIKLIKQNIPKTYEKKIETINNFSTEYLDNSLELVK